MNRQLLTFFLFVKIATSFAQISFEPGYFIDNENHRTECLIRNNEWKNNPDKFIYTSDSTGEKKSGNLTTVKEFGVYNVFRFVRGNIEIDRSPDDPNTITYGNEPVWEKGKFFLKVLVEGKASLYYFEEANLMRFFYSISDTSIKQLVYKRYLVEGGNLSINEGYKIQLMTELSCLDSGMKPIMNLGYNKIDLEEYFKSYNKCKGNPFVVYHPKTDAKMFHVKITAGIDHSSVSIANVYGNSIIHFGNQNNYRASAEAEFVLPYNRHKWSLVFEPAYQYFIAEQKVKRGTATINFKSVEFSAGIRNYLFLNKSSRIYTDAFYNANYSVNFNSLIKFDYADSLVIGTGSNLAFGGGFEFKRFSLELRLNTNRRLLWWYLYWTSKYERTSLILGFKF